MIGNAPVGDAAREVAHAVRRDVPFERADRLGERQARAAIAHLAERRVEVVAPRVDAPVGAAPGLLPLDAPSAAATRGLLSRDSQRAYASADFGADRRTPAAAADPVGSRRQLGVGAPAAVAHLPRRHAERGARHVRSASGGSLLAQVVEERRTTAPNVTGKRWSTNDGRSTTTSSSLSRRERIAAECARPAGDEHLVRRRAAASRRLDRDPALRARLDADRPRHACACLAARRGHDVAAGGERAPRARALGRSPRSCPRRAGARARRAWRA